MSQFHYPGKERLSEKQQGQLEEAVPTSILRMMDSDRPNNYLVGGLQLIGLMDEHLQTGGERGVKRVVTGFVFEAADKICRIRARQVGWTREQVEEELERGREAYRSKRGQSQSR